jgi:uncharacterized protein YbjT (DUF2867 family)
MGVLVVGASGTVGRHVVRALVRRNADVVAFVRNPGPRFAGGVRVIEGDLADPDTVRKAVTGCRAMFLLTPHCPQQVTWQNHAVDAAADVGARVVKLSSWGPAVHADSPVPGARRHWITQQYILKRQLPYTFLQPNYFAQVLVDRYAGHVRRTGRLVSPAGDRGISIVDVRDVAEVAACCLVDPNHDGQTYVLTGPTAPTYAYIAGMLCALTGREVRYVDLTDAQFAEWAAAQGRADWEVAHATEIFRLSRAGAGDRVTGDVERVTGRAPRSIADFLAEHRTAFTPAPRGARAEP